MQQDERLLCFLSFFLFFCPIYAQKQREWTKNYSVKSSKMLTAKYLYILVMPLKRN